MTRTLRKISATAALLLCASLSHAIPLTFEPSDTTVELGDQVAIDVVITPDGTLIGTFDIAVNWDMSILSLFDVTFGDSLGDPEPFAFETLVDVILGGGSAQISEVSLLFGGLAGLQDGSPFTLFTLIFGTSSAGTSALTFGGIILGDEFGFPPFDLPQPGSGTIEVIEIVAVPEPGTLALFGLGLVLMIAARRQRRAVSS